MPDASIIIVNWNTRDLLRQCLTSVMAHTRRVTYELFVVDNASADDSVAMVERDFPAVRLIKNAHNRGFSAANNQALNTAGGRALLLLNSDTRLAEDGISALAEFLEGHPRAGMVGPRLLNPDGSRQYSCDCFPRRPATLLRDKLIDAFRPDNHVTRKGRMQAWNYDTAFQVEYLIGAALMIRRDAFEQIGLLDERFFMYAEDIDWCYRSAQAGWQNWYLGDAQVYHQNRGSSQKTPEQSRRLSQLRTDSLIAFYRKHYGAPAAWSMRAICALKA